MGGRYRARGKKGDGKRLTEKMEREEGTARGKEI